MVDQQKDQQFASMGSNGDEFYPPVDVPVPDLPIESNSPTNLQNLEHDVPYKSLT